MKTKSLILLAASALAVHTSALGSIIDDKSQFIGDFTVIDFETRGDGSPVTGPFDLQPEEYRQLGASITLQSPPYEFARPLVTRLVSPVFIAAHEITGSPEYVLIDTTRAGGLRFDFDRRVNAVGLTILNRFGDRIPGLEVYDASGSLIEEVLFRGNLIDGTIDASQFGLQHDVDYGFFGLYTPDTEISYALLYEGRSGFDDLHFGVIPLPTTLVLLIPAVPLLLSRRRRWRSLGPGAIRIIGVLIVARLSGVASGADVSGTVTGYATRFDGTYLPDTPTNPPQLMDLEGVRVWVAGVTPEISTYTLGDGTYALDIPSGPPVTIKADLSGRWVTVLDFSGNNLLPDHEVTLFPAIGVDLIFNPSPHGEFATAQVNTFVHVNKAHDFGKRFQPQVTALDQAVLCSVSYPSPCSNFFTGGAIHLAWAGTVVQDECTNWCLHHYCRARVCSFY